MDPLPSIGHRIERLDEATSTNTLLLENEAWLAEHGFVLLARHQTAGRGRMGRYWASVPGAQLQFSVVLHTAPVPAGDVPVVALLAGLAVAQALEETLAVQPTLKWPNDVLLEGRKVCGILVEARPDTAGHARLVVGIGINCQGGAADFPSEVRGLLTTLSEASGGPVDNEAVLQAVLERMDTWYRRLAAGEKAALLDAWRARGRLAGRQVRVATPNGPREGRAFDLSPEGYLIVELGDGRRIQQVSGEVAWLD